MLNANTEVVYINVGIMDDEIKARHRAERIVENWSLDLQKPGHGNSQTGPLLWEWLILKIYREKRLLDKNVKVPDPEMINVKARILIRAETPTEFESMLEQRTKFKDIDVVISDIVIPDHEYNGMMFARKWNNAQNAPVFIMVSAFDQAQEAIQIDVADYIVKPLRSEKLSDGLCRAITKKALKDSLNKEWQEEVRDFMEKKLNVLINASSSGKYHSLIVDDVVMFKSDTKCTMVHTNLKEYFSDLSLKKINDIYYPYFLKVRRNCLVSLKHIEGFTNKAKREEMNKDIKGRIWYIRVRYKDGFEDIEIARREWSKIYKICDINPNIDCKRDFIEFDDKMYKTAKANIEYFRNNMTEDIDDNSED